MRYRDWRKQQMRRPGFVLWWLWIAITSRWRNKKLLRMLAQWENEPDVEFDASRVEPFALRLTPAADALSATDDTEPQAQVTADRCAWRYPMWSYGDPHEPKADDPRFDSETAAIDAAVKASNEKDGEPILAVWHDDDGECTTLVWAGWVYSAA